MQSISPDYKARKQGRPTMPLKERLYSKIKVNEYTGCWEWQGTLRNGYGAVDMLREVEKEVKEAPTLTPPIPAPPEKEE